MGGHLNGDDLFHDAFSGYFVGDIVFPKTVVKVQVFVFMVDKLVDTLHIQYARCQFFALVQCHLITNIAYTRQEKKKLVGDGNDIVVYARVIVQNAEESVESFGYFSGK